MNPLLVEEQRKEIINEIDSNPTASNRAIANKLAVTSMKVSATRTWLNKKGSEVYLAETEKKIAEMKTYVNGLFSNHSGTGKRTARKLIVESIGKSKVRGGNILTLPAGTWDIEKLVHETVSPRFGYIAIERNIEVFPLMATKLAWYGVKSRNKAIHGSTAEMILAANEDDYDHMILDYCGTLKTVRQELIHACNNKVVKKDGVITITLQKAHCFGEWVDKLNATRNELTGETTANNTTAYNSFFQFLTSITSFEISEVFEYNDGSPMIVYVLKRTS